MFNILYIDDSVLCTYVGLFKIEGINNKNILFYT